MHSAIENYEMSSNFESMSCGNCGKVRVGTVPVGNKPLQGKFLRKLHRVLICVFLLLIFPDLNMKYIDGLKVLYNPKGSY